MMNSKSLVSLRRSPLWVAAYSFKQLKKVHVFEADISSLVDRILNCEIDAVSYRVLGYLLLGVIRIYSRKVQFLLYDCNEALVKINKFLMNAKDFANVETMRMPITIPERFELDAFDLKILEDSGGRHIARPEDITLKGTTIASQFPFRYVLCKTGGFGPFSLDKFEDFDFGDNACSSNHLQVEGVGRCDLMDMYFDIFPPSSPINLLEDEDLFQNSMFSRKEPMNIDTVLAIEGVETDSVNMLGQDQQINEDQTDQETVPCKDEIHEEISIFSQEEHVDIGKFSGREKEPVLSVEALNESHQVDGEQSLAKEASSSSCQMHQEIIDFHEARNFRESLERPQGDKSYQKECVDHGKSSVAENLEELIEGSVQEHEKEGKLEFQEKVSLEDGRLSIITPESINVDVAPTNVDVTPQSRFQGGSVGRPKPGAATPESLLISTPAVRERSCFPRKRKVVLDRRTVLPDEVVKKSIQDASDLISGRRKFRRTLLANQKGSRIWLAAQQRQSRISRLPDGFCESVLPCNSSELQFLFSKNKMKISDSLEIVETLGKLDVSESGTVGSPGHRATAPQTPPQCTDSLVIEESPAYSPQTPTLCPKIKVSCPERTEIQDTHNLGPSSPHESIQIEQSEIQNPHNLGPSSQPESIQIEQSEIRSTHILGPSSPHESIQIEQSEIQSTNNLGPSSPHESIQIEQSLERDEMLNLMEEDTNSFETENSKSCKNSCKYSLHGFLILFFTVAGWSDRTRKVASHLHSNFVELRKQKENEVVNFSQVVGGRPKKECARLFYEILVLKTSSHVDVQQNNAYGDIAVSKLPKLDQTFEEVDG
ncbi:sister chromatid cohesion 1 protein 2 [Gastrolobium bilobum]|uniref:sister chromatid cohesion 1 protein 2 n=1 Tax=Gastrolobium bilobum TaxID=150636 RepID=UPI002AAF9CEE|nr:sister chromatid cohesion 1 protein 2 [Gastrolobium bilobum]